MSVINCMQSSGKGDFLRAARITLNIAVFECIASLPPRSTEQLPDFRQSEAASDVTLGRASNITAMTPRGTETFLTRRPFGLVISESVLPTGSGRSATSITPFAIPSILSGERRSLSKRTFGNPFSSAAFISLSFSRRI